MKETKICNQCGEEKPIDDFYRAGRGQHRAGCKDCYSSETMPKYNKNKIYKQILTKDYLLDAYVKRGLNPEDIAAEIRSKYPSKYNCTATTISTYLRKHKLSSRSIRSMLTTIDAEAIVKVIPKMEIPDYK